MMEFLWISSKIITSLGLVVLAVVLLVLAIQSRALLRTLKSAEGLSHGASTAILVHGSLVAMILPLVLSSKSKFNIWTTVFNCSPWAKDKRIQKFLKPLTNITESIVELVKKN